MHMLFVYLGYVGDPLSLELPRQSASLEEAKAARNDFMVSFVNEVSATHKGSESEAWRRVGV